MEAERNPPRQFGDPDRPLFDCAGVEDGQIAAVLPAAVNHRDHPSVAFRRIGRAGREDRLTRRVAVGEPVSRAFPCFEVDMGD